MGGKWRGERKKGGVVWEEGREERSSVGRERSGGKDDGQAGQGGGIGGRADAGQGGQGVRGGAGVIGKEGDKDAGQGGADAAAEFKGGVDHSVGRAELVRGDDPGQERALGRVVEGVSQAFKQGQGVDEPEVDASGYYQGGQGCAEDKAEQVAGLHYQAGGETVHQTAAEEHKKDGGGVANGNDYADGGRVAGQEQHQPGEGDKVELVADGGEAAGAPEEAEVAGAEELAESVH